MLALELTTIDLDNAARIAVEDFGKRFDRTGLPRSGRSEQEEYAHRAALWGEPRPVELDARYDVLQGVGLPHHPAREESDQFVGTAERLRLSAPLCSSGLTHVKSPTSRTATAPLGAPKPQFAHVKYRQGPDPT